MNASDLIRRLHQHRMWVNHRLLDAVRPLPESQLRQPLSVGQGSVWKTLAHLMGAEYVWLEALLGNENPLMPGDAPGKLPGNQEGEGAITSLEELTTRWHALDERWCDYLDTLADDTLGETVYKTSTSSGAGKRHGVKRADVLLHLCTHAQYTTAQLVNVLRQTPVAIDQPRTSWLLSKAISRESTRQAPLHNACLDDSRFNG